MLGILIFMVTALAGFSASAQAGSYALRNCQSAPGFSTKAFGDHKTRGMLTKRGCNPSGKGIRGMVAAAKRKRGGKVKFGAVARFTFKAPAGTQIVGVRWSGRRVRSDCGFRMDAYAAGGQLGTRERRFGKTLFEGRKCPQKGNSNVTVRQSRVPSRDAGSYSVAGATRVTQRIICGKRQGCSVKGRNYIRTSSVKITVQDVTAPAVRITGGSLASGVWTKGTQTLTYAASDNSGIRNVFASGQGNRGIAGACAAVVTIARPCGDSSGTVPVDTSPLPEGPSAVRLNATDGSGNVGTSNPVVARIDRTAPGRVGVGVLGGEGWRSAQGFGVAWTNPTEVDRAPIVAARYQLCPLGSATGCVTQRVAGASISRLALNAPKEGQYGLRVWREDAAGNQSESYASDPVALRYDPTAPGVAFEPSSGNDPTLVGVRVSDATSGVARGSLEISREGSNSWQQLPATLAGGRLVTRIRDDLLPPGRYQLRAHAVDQANNERTVVGPTLTLPLRIQSTMTAGFATTKVVKRKVRIKRVHKKKSHRNANHRKARKTSASVSRRKHAKRRRYRIVRRKTTVLKPVRRVGYGRSSKVTGSLTNRDGQGITGPVAVLATVAGGAEQLVARVQANASGGFSYNAKGLGNRTLRFVYTGTQLILPTQASVKMTVPQRSTIAVSRKRVLNGQTVGFDGTVKSRPLPPTGKLVELQVILNGRWQTFKTVRSKSNGRWSSRWRFKSVCGPKPFVYRFRANVTAEGGAPFVAGKTKVVRVKVRGRKACG